MSWRKSWLEAMANKKHVRHSSHTNDIERLEADMAAYLAKGGTIKRVGHNSQVVRRNSNK